MLMNKIRIALLLALSLFVRAVFAEWRSIGKITNVEFHPHAIILTAGTSRVEIIAISESVLRVRVSPIGKFPKDFSWAVVPGANTPNGNITQQGAGMDSDSPIEASTSKVRIRVERAPIRITFFDISGNVLAQDSTHQTTAFNGSEFRVWKSMPEDEHYYGLGDKAGPLDHRNSSFTMWNTDAYGWQEGTDPLYKDTPFFLALRKGRAYGIFLDNTWRSNFDFGKAQRDVYSFGAEGGELDYYFIYGPDPKQVIERFTDLTGRAPLPPVWALGFQQSRYSYFPQSRVEEIARTFREKRIPCDVLYLDIDYQELNRPFTIDKARFPDFSGMIHDLGGMGFKLIVITDLHIAKAPGYPPYDEGMAGNYFAHNPDGSVYSGIVWPGPSVFPDFTWAPARAWWGSLYKNFVTMGVRGFWNDMNEPAVFSRPDKTIPLDVVDRVDSGGTETQRAVHNVFGMENSRATYEGLRKLQGNVRPFVVTRANFAGGQRYAATWTGDNSSTWNHYRISIPTLLSLGVSGMPFVGDDIGGFRGSPEMDTLTRWIELGAFNPVFRDHTEKGSADQEPWVGGPEQEAIRKRYIELRYRLIPYIYTAAEESAHTGLPMMRPLFLEYPHSENLYTNDEEFLFGPDFLVAPKVWDFTTPYDVALPPGIWYDYWTGRQLEHSVSVAPALDQLPLYVRAGAIVPQGPVVQSTAQVPHGPLELRVYPGPDCRGSVYLDDGNTFDNEKGVILRQNFSCTAVQGSVQVKLAPAEGSFAPWWREVELTIYGADHQPAAVIVGGRPTGGVRFTPRVGKVVFTIPWDRAGTEVTVTY